MEQIIFDTAVQKEELTLPELSNLYRKCRDFVKENDIDFDIITPATKQKMNDVNLHLKPREVNTPDIKFLKERPNSKVPEYKTARVFDLNSIPNRTIHGEGITAIENILFGNRDALIQATGCSTSDVNKKYILRNKHAISIGQYLYNSKEPKSVKEIMTALGLLQSIAYHETHALYSRDIIQISEESTNARRKYKLNEDYYDLYKGVHFLE